MALVKKRSNSTRIVIIVIVGLVAAAAGYFLFQRFANPATEDGVTLQTNRQVITEFGESILDDSRYKSLNSFDQEVTVNPESDGHNPNPFE
jgi:hypothetical protein